MQPRLTSLFLLVTALSACRVTVDAGGKECDPTHPCRSGEQCFEGVCVVPCDPKLGQACSAGLGVCATQGIYRCNGGTLLCDAQPPAGTGEVCDGLDNDCNGQVDDALLAPQCLNQGVCAGAAAPTCQGDAGWTACAYGTDYEATETRCDRLDNDCDGTPDDVSGCLYTLVGMESPPGHRDGPADKVWFAYPKYVAADGQGSFYVADQANHRIRKVAADGSTTTVTGIGTCGYLDGPVDTAQLCDPWGIAVASDGTIFFTEIGNDRLRKISGGVVSTVAGSGTQGFRDGDAGLARFNEPYGLSLLPNGDILIADGHNHCLRRYVASTQRVQTEAGACTTAGTTEGTLTTLRLNHPDDVVVDPQTGDYFVTEEVTNRIRKLPGDGGVSSVLAGSTAGTAGYAEGTGTVARFNQPFQLALDAAARILYVTDHNNSRVRSVDIETGVTAVVGNAWGFANGAQNQSRFAGPWGVALDQGNLYVTDENHVLRRIVPSGANWITEDFAGYRAADRVKDGPASTAAVWFPKGIAMGPDGAIYWVEDTTDTLRRLQNDTVTTLIGSITSPISDHVDGAFSVARLSGAMDVVFGPDGTMYLIEASNDDVRVIDLAGQQVTHLAGPIDGTDGYANGTASQARFADPTYGAVGPDGGLYLSDLNNSLVRRVSTTNGDTSDFAGTFNVFTQAAGPLGTGSFQTLRGLAVAPDGTIYVGDQQTIRTVAPDGTLGTLATGTLPWRVMDVALDGTKLVYVIENGVYSLNLSAPVLSPVPLLLPKFGNQDGMPGTASAAFFESIAVTPQYYLLSDGDGHRIRRLWK